MPPRQELSEEQRADVEARTKEFLDEVAKLVERLQVGYMPQLAWVPANEYLYATGVTLQVVDMKYANPSPIQSPQAA